jgi:crossover junction endodeoxyribonuclease RuvC
MRSSRRWKLLAEWVCKRWLSESKSGRFNQRPLVFFSGGMILILGIDPGIGTTGYGLVEESPDGALSLVAYGVISTPPNSPIPSRLQEIYSSVAGLIKKYQPAGSAIEKLLFGKNVTTAMAVGQARGVTILALADGGLSVAEYTPASVKEAVAGYGNASKGQVQDMVRVLLNLDNIPKPDDAADALAIAITHIHASRYQQLYNEGQ